MIGKHDTGLHAPSRARTQPASAQDWWRSPGERQRLLDWQRGEFPIGSDTSPDGLTRRRFLGLAGASLALAGLGGCVAKPASEIIPYVQQPPELTPGVACFYASSLVRDGYATGVLIETHEGRPTKIEGNPDHPASLGASGAQEQAAILDLYDPQRAAGISQGLAPGAWSEARAVLAGTVRSRGRGLHLVLEPSSSVGLARDLTRLRQRLPEAQIYWHATSGHAPELEATTLAFGKPMLAHLTAEGVSRGLMLGADPLASGPWNLRHARGWAEGRRLDASAMSRWYAVESMPSCSGFSADHRLVVDERELANWAAALLGIILQGRSGLPLPLPLQQALSERPRPRTPPAQLRAIAADLLQAGAGGAVFCAERAGSELQLLTVALNAAIGSQQVTYRPSQLIGGDRDELPALVTALHAGAVEQLVLIGGNPCYTAAGDLEFASACAHARQRFRIGQYQDASAIGCDWFLPLVHPLEGWGDARAYDGTISFQQPAIEPLHGGRSTAEIIAALLGEQPQPEHLRLRQAWREQGLDDQAFDAALRRGCLPGSVAPAQRPLLRWTAVAQALHQGGATVGSVSSVASAGAGDGMLVPAASPAGDRVDLLLYLDGKVHDGRGATNAWLQELPDAVTKLTWDNAVLMAPSLAQQLGVVSGRLVELQHGDMVLQAPVLIQPGQAPGTLALALGYGQRSAHTVAGGVGSDGYPWRSRLQPWLVRDIRISLLPGGRALALTQEHWSLEGRPVALEQMVGAPPLAEITAQHAPQPSLRPVIAMTSPQWGMAVDLATCTGCSACVTACQAENNIPVVGRDEVLRSREMHWLRIDRYYSGTLTQPTAINQPMMCQHCEKAPCEYVCPTYATTHSPDGLNEMTYNRCVGTRFCSNNCPYKVRRFNWFNYHAQDAAVTRMAMNPDVTVRDRGVMEKCTYCVQRIREADISARVAGDEPGSRAVVTACQQACPSQAIVFGNVLDPRSQVAQARLSPRAYGALADSGAQPRTRYLARLVNRHPQWP